jgi:putative transposase
VTGHPTATVCRALHTARSTAYLRLRSRIGRFYRRAEDREVLLEIMTVIRERASYGVRRVHALVNRGRRRNGAKPYNLKRIRRLMRINQLTLPGKIRRRDRPHTGTIRRPDSNQRWCGDGLNIRCWNGDLVRVAFTLDCHDREVVGHVAVPRALNGSDAQLLLDRSIWGRFGEVTLKTPIEIEWLTDNDGIFTSLESTVYAEDLGFKPITTPAYSPESNGMAEAFVNTLKRDYVQGADLSDADTVIRQLPGWLEDYNEIAPHSALEYLSPREWRARRKQDETQTLGV